MSNTQTKDLEIREIPISIDDESTEKGAITGYAVIWGVLDEKGTIFDRRSFTQTLKSNRKTPLLWSHKQDEPIGKVLSLEEDNIGLKFEAALNLDVQRAQETLSLLRNNDINGVSIGFRILNARLDQKNQSHITEVKLFEVSLVTLPAVPGAGVISVRSVQDAMSCLIHADDEQIVEQGDQAQEVINTLTTLLTREATSEDTRGNEPDLEETPEPDEPSKTENELLLMLRGKETPDEPTQSLIDLLNS